MCVTVFVFHSLNIQILSFKKTSNSDLKKVRHIFIFDTPNTNIIIIIRHIQQVSHIFILIQRVKVFYLVIYQNSTVKYHLL